MSDINQNSPLNPPDPPIPLMVDEIRDYASRNKMYLDLEGEIGFGRECVGLIHGSGFPSYGGELVPGDYNSGWFTNDEAAPPREASDAYHKSECIAVLGRSNDSITQLWYWVRKLKANDVVLIIEPRKPTHAIEALLHGMTRAVLVGRDRVDSWKDVKKKTE